MGGSFLSIIFTVFYWLILFKCVFIPYLFLSFNFGSCVYVQGEAGREVQLYRRWEDLGGWGDPSIFK